MVLRTALSKLLLELLDQEQVLSPKAQAKRVGLEKESKSKVYSTQHPKIKIKEMGPMAAWSTARPPK